MGWRKIERTNRAQTENGAKEPAMRKDSRWSAGSERGSLTVETALVMPVILFVVVLLVYALFYMYNRCVLTSAAYLAVKQTFYHESESNRIIKENVKEKCEEALQGRLIAVNDIRLTVSVGKFKTRAELTAQMNIPEEGILGMTIPLGEIRVSAFSDRLQPAGLMRMVRKGKKMKEWFEKKEEKSDEGTIQSGYELQLFDSSTQLQLLPDYNVLQE